MGDRRNSVEGGGGVTPTSVAGSSIVGVSTASSAAIQSNTPTTPLISSSLVIPSLSSTPIPHPITLSTSLLTIRMHHRFLSLHPLHSAYIRSHERVTVLLPLSLCSWRNMFFRVYLTVWQGGMYMNPADTNLDTAPQPHLGVCTVPVYG